MIFKNRNHAAALLAEALKSESGPAPLVLGVPRGGVPIARIIADTLNGDLDVVLVHKVGAPDNPEYAIGSVSEFGTVYWRGIPPFHGFTASELKDWADIEIAALQKKRQLYSPIRPPISPKGRTVIVVDDGIATGATMLAAVRAIRQQQPKKIIVASPVAPPTSIAQLTPEVNKVVSLQSPEHFYSISQFYKDFPQVSDAEIFTLLANRDGKKGHVA